MQNEELQKLTASEPLTLEEEYQMQESWRNDNDSALSIVNSAKCSVCVAFRFIQLSDFDCCTLIEVFDLMLLY